MDGKRAFDVDEATERFARSFSPGYDKLSKFAGGRGTSVGSSRAGILKRSLDRFVRGVRDTASTALSTSMAAAHELSNPGYAYAALAFGKSAVDGAKSVAFRTRMHMMELDNAAHRVADGAKLTKFFTPKARTAAVGNPRRHLPAMVLVGILGGAAMTGFIVHGSNPSQASLPSADVEVPSSNAVEIQPIDLVERDVVRTTRIEASLDPVDLSVPGATAAILPIAVERSSAGFAALGDDSRMPSEEFLDIARHTLGAKIKDPAAVDAHINLVVSVLEGCLSSNEPCTVHTGGLDLDPIHGRFIASMPDETGIYRYYSMEIDEQIVALSGQDPDSPVKNPYEYRPGAL